MATTAINILLISAALYLGLGVLFGLYFIISGAKKLDPVIKESGWGVRLLIFPGSVGMWPFLLTRLISSNSKNEKLPALKWGLVIWTVILLILPAVAYQAVTSENEYTPETRAKIPGLSPASSQEFVWKNNLASAYIKSMEDGTYRVLLVFNEPIKAAAPVVLNAKGQVLMKLGPNRRHDFRVDHKPAALIVKDVINDQIVTHLKP